MIIVNISKRLQELLEKTSTSRSKLARSIGVHTTTITNWLDGKEPKLENVTDLARFFNVTTDYLAGTSDSPLPPDASQAQELDYVYFSLAKEMQSEGIHPDDIQYFIELQKRARARHGKTDSQ